MKTATKLIASSAVLMLAGASFSAHAGGNVSWSVTFSSPQPHVYVQPAPVYYEPAPVVYYAPPVVQYRPVYVQPAPVVQYRPVYVQPAPVYYHPGHVAPHPHWHGGHRGHGHGHGRGNSRVIVRVNG